MTTNQSGSQLRLAPADGFSLDAYRAEPATSPRGAIVVLQEIFGVNSHIRSVCDGFARDGYVAIAPALFDRTQPGVDLGYGDADVAAGRDIRGKADSATALLDIAAARDAVRGHGRVGVVGYCWGGYLSWLSACRLDGFSAAVVYYGGGIADVLNEKPRCPVLGHFGKKDAMIPMTAIDTWKTLHPQDPVHVYDAGHGFNCDQRGSFDAASAALARERTLEFFRRHVG
jgi:carboxymethylenebutenolidase